jgi:23S rRNA (uracil1939-C5)-methyltransferase
LRKNDLLELDITDYAFEGKGIGRIQLENDIRSNTNEKKSFVIFVNGSYPGDKVLTKITKIKSSYAEAKIENIISPSFERIKAECTHFGICGGCKQQDLDYQFQIKYKQEQVKDIYERLGHFENYELIAIIPSDKIFYYRNKLEYSFANKRWLLQDDLENKNIDNDNFALGFHVPRIFNKVVDINKCHLQSNESNQILNFTRKFFKSRTVSIYSTQTHSGFLRNLVIKQSRATNELMVNLVTSYEDFELLEEFTSSIRKEIPQITSLVNNINLKKSATAIGNYEKVLFGIGYIHDMIGGFRFRISANSFFQTNTLQAEKLYQTALSFADLKDDEIIYDLYSGAGTISIFISKHCKEVYAFESVFSAIKDAEQNNLLNNITNVKYLEADLNKSFLAIVKINNLPFPDAIILDPPRSGMNPVTIKDVVELKPKRIIYVSCNPTTQVRDLKLFEKDGYVLKKIQPVDMFPQTYHIENVALMVKD